MSLRPMLRWVRRVCVQPVVMGMAHVTAAGLSRLVPGNPAQRVFARRGFHLLRKHYYLPIPEQADYDAVDQMGQTAMVGVDLNEPAALGLLDGVLRPYLHEFRQRFPWQRAQDVPAEAAGDPATFYLINGAFMAVDAPVYYAMIRHFKPLRVVEIGSGWSTRVASAACVTNGGQGGAPCRLTAIEPYPPPFLRTGLPGVSELIEKRLQDVDLSAFTSLSAGDILFIDSTHALREGGDVHLEYCEILPRLAPGVLVHVHDVSLPKFYPRCYRATSTYWNEQYLLQAFLAYNSRFEVLWPGNALMVKYPRQMNEAFPEIQTMRQSYPESEPSSFWMRVRG